MNENAETPLEKLEWQHRLLEIALGKKLPPSEELIRLRNEAAKALGA